MAPGSESEDCNTRAYSVCTQVELEAVRPGEGDGADEELRLSIAILPLRLRIDQAVADFCQVHTVSLWVHAHANHT